MDANKQAQLQSDREHAKREWKNYSLMEKIVAIAVPIIGLGAMILVTLFVFILKGGPCDTDKVGLWCRTHPMTGWDILGLVLFYIGAAFITSIIPRIAIRLGWLEDDDDKFPGLYLVSAILAVAGFTIMYAA